MQRLFHNLVTRQDEAHAVAEAPFMTLLQPVTAVSANAGGPPTGVDDVETDFELLSAAETMLSYMPPTLFHVRGNRMDLFCRATLRDRPS